MDATIVISARGLTKRYQALTAVGGVSFDIRQGEIFGFLGPNGAGKTSIMKMITCVSPVTDGELRVCGLNVAREQRAIKALLGVVSQADSLDGGLNVLQNLLVYARFFDLPAKTASLRAWEALDLFQLKDRGYQNPDELSGGMRRRLLIARALLHDPHILVLDEPTTGLDPQTRLLVWDRLLQLKARGVTILLTTHYMEEAAYLCDRLIVMDSGNILVQGSPAQLIHTYAGDDVVEVKVREMDKAALEQDLRLKGIEFEDRGDSIFLYGENGARLTDSARVDGHQVIRRPGNLEDVFLKLTGRGLREE